eukprot:31148-Pelagococcus_subviridis.AAC.7
MKRYRPRRRSTPRPAPLGRSESSRFARAANPTPRRASTPARCRPRCRSRRRRRPGRNARTRSPRSATIASLARSPSRESPAAAAAAAAAATRSNQGRSVRANVGAESKGVGGGVERRRGVSGSKPRGDGRRDTPGEKCEIERASDASSSSPPPPIRAARSSLSSSVALSATHSSSASRARFSSALRRRLSSPNRSIAGAGVARNASARKLRVDARTASPHPFAKCARYRASSSGRAT